MEIIQWTVVTGTAAFVAMVGYFQWRTAEQKAVLDLFERRHEIYQTVANSVGQMCRNSQGFDSQQEKEFLFAWGRAYFFFGNDVEDYLKQLWNDIVVVRTVDAALGTPGDHANAIQRRYEAFKRISEFEKNGRPLFGRYMRFSQTIPLTAVERIKAWVHSKSC
jgi:hypothetical protein